MAEKGHAQTRDRTARPGARTMNESARSGSGFAGVLAIVAVLAYLGLEIHGLHRSRERMQPASIYAEFVGARHAVSACGAEADERRAFEANFAVVEAQAARDLAARQPTASAAQREEALARQRRSREDEVDALIAEQGCDGKDVWRLLKLHEVRSRLSLGD